MKAEYMISCPLGAPKYEIGVISCRLGAPKYEIGVKISTRRIQFNSMMSAAAAWPIPMERTRNQRPIFRYNRPALLTSFLMY